MRLLFFLGLTGACASGCGRTYVEDRTFDGRDARLAEPEVCNNLDDDLDGNVDEEFRDGLGRYVDLRHCGVCNNACPTSIPNATRVACVVRPLAARGLPTTIDAGVRDGGLLDASIRSDVRDSGTTRDGAPRDGANAIDGATLPSNGGSAFCAAAACLPGFAVSYEGRCVPKYDSLCLECTNDDACGAFPEASCDNVGGERRCTVTRCSSAGERCPTGYACESDRCIPTSRSCTCTVGATFDIACALTDPMGELCAGRQTCNSGVLSTCASFAEVCDGIDNDCNGNIDDGFRDSRGAYSLDIANCGQCGVDCRVGPVRVDDLVCGGDPFAPRCVLDCPDARDGIQNGDHIDADLDVANGCECVVSRLDDIPGPVRTSGSSLDTNCDGADGIVISSFYVAVDGSDEGPGSPTRPFRTISRAIERAAQSARVSQPRTDVFIASGTYAERLILPDGVRLHGGYRRDFLSLDPAGFRVDVRAPLTAASAFGAVLVTESGAGATSTVIEWMTLRGRDAVDGKPAVGVWIESPGERFEIRDSEIYSGRGGSGGNGMRGAAGATAPENARAGDLPRAAIENAGRACMRVEANRVRGGSGGSQRCRGVDVSGGEGGSSQCPQEDGPAQPSGAVGRGTLGGVGGIGGIDSNGPITPRRMDSTCNAAACCGLADFNVPGDFHGPETGTVGRDGSDGSPGRGCTDMFGRPTRMGDLDDWIQEMATAGATGIDGGGGGGGGAGGGVEFDWTPPACMFVDGLGGGGGGGGGGGCAGLAGGGGGNGGHSIGVFVNATPALDRSLLTNVRVIAGAGGRGGDGGAGGDGGLGARGAEGGSIPRELRTNPTLAGAFSGARGGSGGKGGAGGGGGGGCGGSSIGIWAQGASRVQVPGVMFTAGVAGRGGRGGGGALAGAAGMNGGTVLLHAE